MIKTKNKKLKAVIPAAGLGTRFLPLTKAQPKEMLPVYNKPVIQYVVEEAVEAGIENILMITGKGKRAIEDHFDRAVMLEMFLEKAGKMKELEEVRKTAELANIVFLRQKEPLGLGHAILQAKEYIGNNDYFCVLLGDTIASGCIREMLKIHAKYKASVIAIQEVERSEVSKYGIVKLGDRIDEHVYEITDLVEKPSIEEAPSNYAILGRYILSSEIFDCLENISFGFGGELQLTDAIRELVGGGRRVLGYIYKGKVYDIGDIKGWLKANIEIAEKKGIGWL